MSISTSYGNTVNSVISPYAAGNRSNHVSNTASQVNKSFSDVGRNFTVYLKDEDTLYSGGNMTGLSYTLKYAEDSTPEDPVIIAKGIDENGDEFEQRIHTNDIKASNATIVELRAMQASRGLDTSLSLTSLPPEVGKLGLFDRVNIFDLFEKAIEDMKMLGRFDYALLFEKSMEGFR